ncbi:MAG TPA: hypothetical protein ENN22_07755 [bacterium]|nr:hypothetical protein [bacterium]
MNILLMCLMIILKGASSQDKSHAEQAAGFYVEIRTDSEPEMTMDAFIDITSIHDLPGESVSIKDSEGKPDRVWIGANLCLLLEKKLGLSCGLIKKISISAPDGYISVISGELLYALETGMCAYAIKGETKLPPKYGYMRLLFPQLRAMYWVNAPDKIIIELGKAQHTSEHHAFYFLENENFNRIIKKDLNGKPYIAMADILVNLDATRQPFRILTEDGLFREYGVHYINRRLVLQQEPSGAWKMTGIAVPLGLKTRNIFLITAQNKVLFLKPLSTAEQAVFNTSYFQNIMKNFPDHAEMTLEIVLRDGRRVPAQKIKPSIEFHQNLYRVIDQQRSNYANVDHIVLTISAN